MNDCYGCGTPTSDVHSGSYECNDCWYWRKMDGPAARHWAKVGETFLSNVDLHDLMTYLPACLGSQEDAVTLLRLAQKLTGRSQAMLAQHGAQGPFRTLDQMRADHEHDAYAEQVSA